MDPSNVRILFADGHPKSPFDSAWGKIFSGGRPPLRKQDLANRRVCLRHAVFAFYGYASPMTINWFRADPCKSSSWLGAFSHQVTQISYGLEFPEAEGDIHALPVVWSTSFFRLLKRLRLAFPYSGTRGI